MKKKGILNAQLLGELAKLRHTDKLVICDAGYPIPKDGNVVDVSLTEGVPSFEQTLRAVVNEMVLEEYVAFRVMQEKNPDCYRLVTELFRNQKSAFVTMPEFWSWQKMPSCLFGRVSCARRQTSCWFPLPEQHQQ